MNLRLYFLSIMTIFSLTELSAAKKIESNLELRRKQNKNFAGDRARFTDKDESIELDDTFKEDRSITPRQVSILGAFGYTFGAKLNTKALGTNAIKNSSSYMVTPQRKFRNWNKYLVDVTPVSGKIYQISSVYFVDSENDLWREKEIVVSLLKEKYPESTTETGMGGGTILKNCFYYINKATGRYVYLTIQEDDGIKGLMLTYTDQKLAELAKQEEIKMEKEQSNGDLL